MMKWLNKRSAVAVVASLLLIGGLGCSEDDVVENQGQNEVEEDAGPDAEDEDTSEPDDVGDVDGGEDADTGDDNGGYDNQFDVDPVDCWYPPEPEDDDCPDGDFGPATFFSEFEIADDPDNPCCFDLEGGSEDPEDFDNFLGETIVAEVEGNLTGFEDVNENIATSIEAGYLTYVLEAHRWQHPEWDDALQLNVYRGGDTDYSMSDNLAGDGAFRVDPDNFDDDGEPRYGFQQVRVVDGEMQGAAGRIEITLPSLVEDLGVILADVQIRGDVVQNPDPDLSAGGEFAIEDGELGGVLLRDEFYKSLNEAGYECDCLDLDFEDPDNPDPWTEGVFGFNEDNDVWQCQLKGGADDACEDADAPRCRTLGDADLCNVLGPFSSSEVTDMEVDGEHGYSVGARFESVTTEITGISD